MSDVAASVGHMGTAPEETNDYESGRMGERATYVGIDEAALDLLFEADATTLPSKIRELQAAGAPRFELGEMWDGLHFLLTGGSADTPVEGEPLSEAIVGVHIFDAPDFIGCTEHDELDDVIAALDLVPIADLVAAANFAAFDDARLWPYDWAENADARRAALAGAFAKLARFTTECRDAGLHLIANLADPERSPDARVEADTDAPVPPLPEVVESALSVEDFWAIIALFDWDETGDDEAVLQPAADALAARPVEDIFGFTDLLAQYLFALDTREHARYAYLGELDPDNGDDYISSDDFLYMRCAVVANGRDFTASVIADPTQMPSDVEFESLVYLADVAYEEKVGEVYEHDSDVSYESFSNAEGWATGTTSPGIYTGEHIPPGNRRP